MPRLRYKKPAVGDVYGSWTILEEGHRCLCRCVCGGEHSVLKASIVNGASTRCKSCRSRENGLDNRQFHYPEGATIRLIHQVRAAMQRCINPKNKKWPDYGGRGIRVHQDWLDDQTKFVAYLMTVDGWNDRSLVLDRANNDGNYEPGNLRFVTHSESMYNRRKPRRRKKNEDTVCG
jgi:hypothetical protein